MHEHFCSDVQISLSLQISFPLQGYTSLWFCPCAMRKRKTICWKLDQNFCSHPSIDLDVLFTVKLNYKSVKYVLLMNQYKMVVCKSRIMMNFLHSSFDFWSLQDQPTSLFYAFTCYLKLSLRSKWVSPAKMKRDDYKE